MKKDLAMEERTREPKAVVTNLESQIPQAWSPIGGSRTVSVNGNVEDHTWYFLRMNKRQMPTFQDVAQELKLEEIVIATGLCWINGNGNIPVAYRNGETNHLQSLTYGDGEFFASHGLAILEQKYIWGKNLQVVSYDCSHDVVQTGIPIDHMNQNGWYPVEYNNHVVIWATGLYLYPKSLEWQIGMDKKFPGKGTRIYDFSRERVQLVRDFFRESVGYEAIEPAKEYFHLADRNDPRCGKWTCRSQYPGRWKPNFPGWEISRFGKIECRWKQPKEGPPRFYGMVVK